MTKPQLPHQLKRRPCSACKSKDRVTLCSPCYAALIKRLRRYENNVAHALSHLPSEPSLVKKILLALSVKDRMFPKAPNLGPPDPTIPENHPQLQLISPVCQPCLYCGQEKTQ